MKPKSVNLDIEAENSIKCLCIGYIRSDVHSNDTHSDYDMGLILLLWQMIPHISFQWLLISTLSTGA